MTRLTPRDFVAALAPHPETRLACTVALAPHAAAREAWTRWLERLGPSGIVAVSVATGRILPLIATRLEALGVLAEATGRPRGSHRKSLTNNLIYWNQLRPVLEALSARGVPVALAGGLGRARTVYPDMGARFLTRADLMVPPERLGDALEVMRGLPRWNPRFSVRADPPVSDHHRFIGPGPHELLLRSHLVPASLGHGPDRWDQLRPLAPFTGVERLELLQLAPEQAVIQTASDALVGSADRFVDWLPDLALTIADPTFSWPTLLAEAERYDLGLTLATALGCLPLVGVDLPERVLPALQAIGARSPREASALSARLDPRGRPLDAIWRDYRHAVAPDLDPLAAAAGFVRYAALRLGLTDPRAFVDRAPLLVARVRARLRRT